MPTKHDFISDVSSRKQSWILVVRVVRAWFVQDYENKRLNSSFHPLTFTKLRFWPPKDKNTKPPLSFATVGVLAPQGQFLVKKIIKKKNVAPHLGCHVSIDRVKIGLEGQNCHKCKT